MQKIISAGFAAMEIQRTIIIYMRTSGKYDCEGEISLSKKGAAPYFIYFSHYLLYKCEKIEYTVKVGKLKLCLSLIF